MKKRQLISKFFALLICISVFASLCTQYSASAITTNEVATRIVDLCEKLGIPNLDVYSGKEQTGIYFTTDKAKATDDNDPRTTNLSVAKAQWFIDLFGSGVSSSSFSQGNTCNGFAKFAQWYIFSGDPSKSVPVTWQGYKTSNKENAGNCVIGDRISFNSTKKDDYHQAIYLGCNDTGFIVLDSNSVVHPSNIVAIHTITYSTFSTFDCGRPSDVVVSTPGDSGTDTDADDVIYLENLPQIDSERYTGNRGDSFVKKIGTRNKPEGVSGTSYEHGLEAWVARWNDYKEKSWVWADYELAGAYNTLTGVLDYCHYSFDDWDYTKYSHIAQAEIIADGKIIFSERLDSSTQYPIDINLDVTGVSILRVYVYDLEESKVGASYLFGNMILTDDKEPPNNSDKRYPIGYDPQKDRWNFSNQTIAIPKSIYKKAFGNIKGAVMYFKDCAFASKKPGEGGSCYGMAASTGTFVKNYIDVTSVLCQPISAPGLYASHLYQCWNGSGGIHDSYIPAANMTVSEFVMYGQLSQKDYDMSRQMKNSKYDFEGLYSATVDYVNGTGEPVVVSMVGELNGQRVGHAIYVCGIGVDNENYTEILVNDSNHPTDVPRKLILNKTNGSYSGWEYDLNSNTHWGTGKKYEKISYSFPSYFLYVVGICNSEMVAEKNSEWMSSEANLVVIDGDAEGLNIDDEKIYPIESSAGIGEIEEDVSGFWLEPGIDEISFISKNDESSIIFANNKVAVDVQTDKNVLTDLTIDEKNYYVSIQANKGEKVTLAVHTQSSDNTEYEYTISGNVHENKVSVERNEDNIIFVKGLNNVDINLNKNGNEENTVAAVSDGRQIKISIDDSNNTVIASYEAEQTEDICGYCGKVHGTSFKEVLIKFFHRIFYFFVKLFGLKK